MVIMSLKGLPIIQVRKTLLKTAQKHVNTIGWVQRAIVLAAEEHQFPVPIANRVFKVTDLIEFTMDGWSNQLREETKGQTFQGDLKEKLSLLVRKRLECEVPYLPRWHEAMKIGVSTPFNMFMTSYKLLGHMEQIWRLAGDVNKDSAWLSKQAALLNVFSTTELQMLKDSSEGREATWAHLAQALEQHYPTLTGSTPIWSAPCSVYSVASKVFDVQAFVPPR
jgi:rpsU-divergently transcribed protein